MDPKVMWMLVAVVMAMAVAGWFVWMRRRSEQLRERFGPEYERTVHEVGDVRKAEASLAARAKRVEAFHIRPLSPDEADRYSAAWQRVQSQFVDDPGRAITDADKLVGEVMTARGYPVGEFDQRVEDISRGSPRCGDELPRRPGDRAPARTGTRQHGGPAPGDGPLSRAVP